MPKPTRTKKQEPHRDNRISPVNKYSKYDEHARISANKPPNNITVSNIDIKKPSKIDFLLLVAVVICECFDFCSLDALGWF